MITVFAYAEAAPGKEEELEKALLELVSQTRREEGCINYDLYRRADAVGAYTFYENWVDMPALERHRETQHVRRFREEAGALLAGPLRVEICLMLSPPGGTK